MGDVPIQLKEEIDIPGAQLLVIELCTVTDEWYTNLGGSNLSVLHVHASGHSLPSGMG